MNSLFLRIPATTANLGPGFDVFGMALNLYNYIFIEFSEDANFEIKNIKNEILFSKNSVNLIYLSYCNVLKKFLYKEEELPKWKATIKMEVSIGRGFGSSATAIVAGVEIAKYILSKNQKIELNLEQEIQFFLELENHPDNVVPARLGGWVFCYDPKIIIRKTIPEELGICAIIPDFEINTEDSRKKLKSLHSTKDALSNIKGCLLWMEYLHSKNPEFLKIALSSDTFHEPIRYQSIPYYLELKNFIKKNQLYGMSLSGSGPSIILYYDKLKENTIKERILEFCDFLNRKKSHKIILKFCLPDYNGLITYQQIAENFFVEEETFINL